MHYKSEAILAFVREKNGPVAFRDIMFQFGITKAQRSHFKEFVDEMVESGDLIRLKGTVYSLPEDKGLIRGRLSSHSDGYGFVIPEEGGEDIFIPARYMRDNLHGDIVEVRVVSVKRFGKREGRIIRTLERGFARVVGRYEMSGNSGYVIPDEKKFTKYIHIPPKGGLMAKPGQIVAVEVTAYPTKQRGLEGRIIQVIGWPDDPEVEVMTVIARHELPTQFPPEVIKEARAFSQTVSEEEIAGRVDLRGNLTVTIDGETARDFDDAVSVRREANGSIRLWVSIADVSHYVSPGSQLDNEAYLRGTSVYFPDRCIPMLPEELSNGICSLNPHVDRMTITAEMLFGKNGELLDRSFYPSVIKSAARLTYTSVRKVLVDKDVAELEKYAELIPDLGIMEELALRLTKKRRLRGSIDFDLPEPQIILDLQGQTEAIIKAERNLAHRIIEEFMLAANEAVASAIEEKMIPSLYRVHEPPDPAKLFDFKEFIFNFGYEFEMEGEGVNPLELQRLLDLAEGKPEERMINQVLLRCMKQARYSAANLGHFGLAAKSYTHFTSPIRRYPDLVIHRILAGMLAGKLKQRDIDHLASTLPEVALQCSKRERIAMEAEREIVELKKLQFMRDKVGEEFDGFISGVTSFGFFVELTELFVEGMVHVTMLPPDFYRYIEKQHTLMGERTKECYRIGDKIRVRIAGVSLEKKQIEFVPAGVHEPRSEAPRGSEEVYQRVPVKGKRPASLKKGVENEAGKGKGKGRGAKGTGKKRPR